MDSKGRLLIPSHVRDLLDLRNRSELRLSIDNKTITVTPINQDGNARIKIVLRNIRDLSHVLDILGKSNVNILSSKTEIVNSTENSNRYKWSAVLETNGNDLGNLRKSIMSIKNIEHVAIIAKN